MFTAKYDTFTFPCKTGVGVSIYNIQRKMRILYDDNTKYIGSSTSKTYASGTTHVNSVSIPQLPFIKVSSNANALLRIINSSGHAVNDFSGVYNFAKCDGLVGIEISSVSEANSDIFINTPNNFNNRMIYKIAPSPATTFIPEVGFYHFTDEFYTTAPGSAFAVQLNSLTNCIIYFDTGFELGPGGNRTEFDSSSSIKSTLYISNCTGGSIDLSGISKWSSVYYNGAIVPSVIANSSPIINGPNLDVADGELALSLINNGYVFVVDMSTYNNMSYFDFNQSVGDISGITFPTSWAANTRPIKNISIRTSTGSTVSTLNFSSYIFEDNATISLNTLNSQPFTNVLPLSTPTNDGYMISYTSMPLFTTLDLTPADSKLKSLNLSLSALTSIIIPLEGPSTNGTSISITSCTALTTLDISNWTSLATLTIGSNTLLNSLTLPINNYLPGTNISCTSNVSITSLDFSNFVAGSTVTVTGNSTLTSLILPSLTGSGYTDTAYNVSGNAILNQSYDVPFATRSFNASNCSINTINLDSIINYIYSNKTSYTYAAGTKSLTLTGTNMGIPTGTYQAPAGYIQANNSTVGNDGTPANAKEQIYVLVNQNIDNTITKKYKWSISTK